MNCNVYLGMTQRTFEQAVIHLLQTDYGVLGSQRVLSLLAEDVQQLAKSFYPAPEHLAPGWMVFTGTKASGPKVHPGQSAGEHELVTLAWPVLLPEDIQELAQLPESRAARLAWQQKRLVRLIEHGCQHPQGPVLLTLADLAVMTGIGRRQVSRALQIARQQTGKPLPTTGYYFDQGMRPTHKTEIIALYETGLDEVAIARQSVHSAVSVGKYIRDYERVKLLLSHGTPPEQIRSLIDMQPNMVTAYEKMVAEYHPELLPAKTPSNQQ
jgi:hypothetical protein